jgi:16S rRNA (adenine1518-N6/adenine1519-N6)-dimethyltransferase
VELGPGLGHLTQHLLDTGAKVFAVERDRDMVRVLEGRKLEGLTVVAGNAADIHFAKVAGTSPVAVAGNLPYHLTSSILFQCLEQHRDISRAVFTLQKEVVTRLSAEPGNRDYGLLSVLLGLYFDVESLFLLPRHLFHPPPQVDSAVIRLTALPKPRAEVSDDDHFIRVVKAGFAQRRKTLLNSLKSNPSLGDSQTLQRALESAGIDPQRRAETLSVTEFAALERALAALSKN